MNPAILIIMALAGAVATGVGPSRWAKWTAFLSTLAIFAVSVVFAVQFPEWRTGKYWPSVDDGSAMKAFGINLQMGGDSVNMLLLLLTTFMMPLTLAGSFSAITERVREHFSTPSVETVKTWTCDLPQAKRAEWIKCEQDLFDALNDAVEAVNHRTTLVQG